jgi:hypothetical protein
MKKKTATDLEVSDNKPTGNSEPLCADISLMKGQNNSIYLFSWKILFANGQ